MFRIGSSRSFLRRVDWYLLQVSSWVRGCFIGDQSALGRQILSRSMTHSRPARMHSGLDVLWQVKGHKRHPDSAVRRVRQLPVHVSSNMGRFPCVRLACIRRCGMVSTSGKQGLSRSQDRNHDNEKDSSDWNNFFCCAYAFRSTLHIATPNSSTPSPDIMSLHAESAPPPNPHALDSINYEIPMQCLQNKTKNAVIFIVGIPNRDPER